LGNENTETDGFPFLEKLVHNITENILVDRGKFFTIRVLFLLPLKGSRKIHSEDFYSFVQVNIYSVCDCVIVCVCVRVYVCLYAYKDIDLSFY
jgi:hypothetical protein